MKFHLPTLNFVAKRKHSYQVILGRDTAEHRAVLADLAKFCRAFADCTVPGDHDSTLLALGRHQVWLRIQEHLNIPAEELYKRYGGPTVVKDMSE